MTKLVHSISALMALVGAHRAAEAAAAAPAPVPLQPTSDWIVAEQAGSCAVTRTFGTGQQAVELTFKKFGPTRHFRLVAKGHPLALRDRIPTGYTSAPRALIKFGFEPDESLHTHQDSWIGRDVAGRPVFMTYESLADAKERRRRKDQHVYAEPGQWNRVPFWQSDQKREAEVNRLTFAGPIATPVTLQLGSMQEPMAALRQCLEAQMAKWGLDVDAHRSLTRAAQPVPKTLYLKEGDYPVKMILERASAIVHARFLIDEEGRATDCLVLDPQPPEDLNQATCARLTERGKFLPALDASGRPIKSMFLVNVNWLMMPSR